MTSSSAAPNIARLDGKVALITGASSGIGAGTAVLFAQLGAKLSLTGRNVENLSKTGAECEKVASEKFPGVLAYCMSKSAIDQMTRCIALELAPKQVRVNSVNPGVIQTEIHKRGGMNDEDYAKAHFHRKSINLMIGVFLSSCLVFDVIAPIVKVDKNYYTHFIPVNSDRHWIFWVKSLKDAKIGLFETKSDNNITYEIFLGSSGNKYTKIAETINGANKWAYTNGILDEHSFRPFCIQWSNTSVSVGKGTREGTYGISTYNRSQPKGVVYLAIATYGNITGYWMLQSTCRKT